MEIKIGDRVVIATKATGTPTVVVGVVEQVKKGEYATTYVVGNIEDRRCLWWSYGNKESKTKSTIEVYDYAIAKIPNSAKVIYITKEKYLHCEHISHDDISLLGKEIYFNAGTGKKRNELVKGVVEKETKKTFTVNNVRYQKKDNVAIVEEV